MISLHNASVAEGTTSRRFHWNSSIEQKDRFVHLKMCKVFKVTDNLLMDT